MHYYQDTYYQERDREFVRRMKKTYGIMAGGLFITFLSAALSAYFLPQLIFSFPLAVILLVAQVVTVMALSSAIGRAKHGTVLAMFVAYAILTGLSISYIFALYEMTTICLTFAATALSFGLLSIMGYQTEKDLSGWGRFILVGLIGLLILSVVSFFVGSTLMETMICCLGLVLFLGITAYDTQRLKQYHENTYRSSQEAKSVSVYFALRLYLDFINIFLYMIRLLGRSRN